MPNIENVKTVSTALATIKFVARKQITSYNFATKEIISSRGSDGDISLKIVKEHINLIKALENANNYNMYIDISAPIDINGNVYGIRIDIKNKNYRIGYGVTGWGSIVKVKNKKQVNNLERILLLNDFIFSDKI